MMVQESVTVGAASSQVQPTTATDGQPATTTQPVAVQPGNVEDQGSDADVSSMLFGTKEDGPGDQEEVWNGEEFVLSPPRSEAFHKSSPDKGMASSSKDSPEVTALMDLIKTLQSSIVQLQADMNVLKEENKELKHVRRNYDGDGTGDMKPLVDIDKKDVEKPPKFKGDPMQWRSWSAKFANFLGRRDGRWPKLIKAIQEKSNQAMTEELEDQIYDDMGIDTENQTGKALKFKFREQFQEYLENFTEGTARAMVQAGGKDAVMETFRVMCDEGHSKRHRHLRKEYRAVTNPKQATFENVRQAIVQWESDVTEYENAADNRLDPRTRISCLEDICPDLLQQHLASKDNLKTYAEYKSAINDYILERKRWTTPNSRGKINWLGLSEAKDVHDNEAENEDHDDMGNEVEDIISDDFMTEVKATLLALVRDKHAKGGKRKDKGGGRDKGRGGSGTGSSTMEVDEPVCFECGEPMKTCGHSAKDCPIRVARVAAGGPARLPKGDGKGKAGKGGGGKGGGKGNGGKGGWPTRQAWNQYYPGPSQAQWRGWYPQQATTPPNKLNLFQQPLQLSTVSPLQALLNGPGTCYAIRPKDRVEGKRQPNFEHKNKFEALSGDDEERSSGTPMVVNLCDAIKRESPNKSRKRHTSTDSLASLPPTCTHTRWQGRPGYCGAKDPARAKTERRMKAKDDDDAGDTGSREPWESRLTSRLAKPCTYSAGEVDVKGTESHTAPTAHQNFLDSKTLMQNLKDFVNNPRDGMANGRFAKLNVLNPVQKREGLKAVAPTRTVSSMGGKFEVLTSVVDSGATVPTMHPDDAAAYELMESQASRDGVEYEVANLETIPNLGEKKFAVLTSEGTIRGYQTQCAEIGKGKPLQAVRALVGSKHAVCFGLGENDDEHLIINKISGEVNKMRDDGINYLQDLLVVPPDQIENVQQQLYLLQQAQQNPDEADFGWQGR